MDNVDGRFRTIAAVLILLVRKNANGDTEYLLQKRQNTGFADGMWDFSASGHVEKGEPMTKTVVVKQKKKLESMSIQRMLNLWGYYILLVMMNRGF